jgi:feruloyl esterase
MKKFRCHHARVLGLAVSAAVLGGCGGGSNDAAPVPPQSVSCSDLAKTTVAAVSTVITAAEQIDASAAQPWTSPNGGGGSATVTQPFCRVAGSIRPSVASDIQFELWMPLAGSWNSKFAGTASGGSGGYIAYGTVKSHLALGYASIGHNNGHPNSQVDWALTPDRKLDFASRAMHVTTQVGKELTERYYASSPKHAYYNGCSQSGHHGIMEMQRYPDDYDGIIAGAPASDWTGTLAAEANAALAQWLTPGAGVSKALQATVRANMLAACDGKPGIDQLADGVLDDPRRCNYDVAAMQCGAPGADPAACLTPVQVQALKTAQAGRRKSTGEVVALGYPDAIGGLFFPTTTTSPDAPQGSWSNHWRYAVLGNPTYDFKNFNWDTDVDYARDKEGATYDAINGNYSAFADRGGKFLMYHGWSDSLITPALTLDEWGRMRAQMGGVKVDSFARLFMVPGMDHCGGGSGTSTFQLMTTLADWVEKGVAPDSTTAANTPIASRAAATGVTARTRPLCPYPKVATYKGTGSIDDAASFTCTSP